MPKSAPWAGHSSNLLVGEAFTWVGAEEGEWTLGEEPVLRAGDDLVIAGIDTPGLHVISKDGVPQATLAVRALDAAESDLGDTNRGQSDSEGSNDELEADLSGFDTALLLLVLLLLGADWWVLRRAERALTA